MCSSDLRAGPQSAKEPLASLRQPNGGTTFGAGGVSSCAAQLSTEAMSRLKRRLLADQKRVRIPLADSKVAKLHAEVAAVASKLYEDGGRRFWQTSHNAQALGRPLYEPTEAEEAARLKELSEVMSILKPSYLEVLKTLWSRDRPERVFTLTFKL